MLVLDIMLKKSILKYFLYTSLFWITVFILVLDSNCYGQNEKEILRKLRQQYCEISSISFSSTMTTKLYLQGNTTNEKNIQTTQGKYHFYGSDEKYRIDLTYGRGDKIEGEYSLAYNKDRFQLFNRLGSMLSYQRQDSNRHTMYPPNPILSPISFILPQGNYSNGVKLGFQDIRDEHSWAQSFNNFKIIKKSSKDDGAKIELKESMGDKKFIFHITFDTESHNLPKQIDQLIPDDNMIIKYIIDEYQEYASDTQVTYWPKIVRVQVMKNNKLVYEIKHVIEELKINQPSPPSIFTLDMSLAEIIWDSDYQTFVKTRGGFRLPTKIVDLAVDNNDHTNRLLDNKEKQERDEKINTTSPYNLNEGHRDSANVDKRPTNWSKWLGITCFVLALIVLILFIKRKR